MRDDEILTKRLSDWKPETDIKLQKAFGKFVEEAGELLEAIDIYQSSYDNPSYLEAIYDLENEIADCDAVITMIVKASKSVSEIEFIRETIQIKPINVGLLNCQDKTLLYLTSVIGQILSIVGRCQIQGLKGKQPESDKFNITILTEKILYFRQSISHVIHLLGLDKERILKRRESKIDSKLPWVMGTATDLLPDIQ